VLPHHQHNADLYGGTSRQQHRQRDVIHARPLRSIPTNRSSSSTPPRCNFGSSDLQRLIADLFGVSSSPRRPRPRHHKLCLVSIKYSCGDHLGLRDLRRLALHVFSCSFSSPPRHARGLGIADLDTLGGLALPILGSSDLRDLINFCASSL
jgi:hypothetical protein